MTYKFIPVGHQKQMAVFSKQGALRLASVVRRYCDKYSGQSGKFVLYGGGSYRSWPVKVYGVMPTPQYHYRPAKGYRDSDWQVRVILESDGDDSIISSDRRHFAPCLGSWRLAVVREEGCLKRQK